MVCAALLGFAVGIVLKPILRQSSQATVINSGVKKPATSGGVSPTPASPLYSLAIPSQRERDYPGSQVTIETPAADKDGYRESVVSYRSDGLKIYSQVLLPATPEPAGGYPAIILVHGYVLPSGYATDEAFYTGFARNYVAKGFVVIKPDLRGHGRSWGVPEGAYFSAGYAADVLNLAASLERYAPVNASKLVLFGHSMGAHVALNTLLVRPQAFKAAVLASGSVGQLGDMYYNWTAFSDFGDPVTLGIRRRVIALFGEPHNGDEFWRQTDPYTFLSTLKTPLLLAHDPNDDTVPYRFSKQLDTAVRAVGGPVTLTDYSGGHSFDGAARQPFIDDSVAFATARLNAK